MERKSFEFVGTTCTSLSLDPGEFAGMTVRAITEEILEVLESIAPGVNYFVDDVVEAAHELAKAADST